MMWRGSESDVLEFDLTKILIDLERGNERGHVRG